MAFELPPLPYDYNALEPHIDEQTMRLHHDKHHAGYTTKLNDAVASSSELSGKTIEQLLGSLNAVPANLRGTVRNNGGGYYNHNLFWVVMGPNAGGKPSGELASAIDQAFGSFDTFKDAFSQAAATQFGSGWAWLEVGRDGKLVISSTPNQDNPLMTDLGYSGNTPILGLDVWEHAYYLKYQNRRPDYIGAFWNVINWAKVAENFARAR